jgi:hypothetical protein
LAGESVSVLQERLASEQKLVALIDRIHSAKSLDAIFFEVQGEILSFLDTERMTLYVVDPEKKELFSKFLALDTVKEIRVPINEASVAGFVAFNPQIVNIADAYNTAEIQRVSPKLRFDASWDKKTGFKTQQILAMPILHESKTVVGVMQLLNKKKGGRFTKEDESNVARIAKTLGVAFHTQQMLVQKRGNKFDYLLSQGLVTQDELNKAVATARQKQVDVETVLIEQYKVPKHELGASLSQFYRVPFFEFTEKLIPPPDIMRDLKIEFLKRNLWLPLRRDEHGHIVVLIDNPQDIQKVDSIHQVMRGHKVTLAVGLRKDIQQWLNVVGGESANKGNIGEIHREGARLRGRRGRRERQRGHSPRQPDHRRRLQGPRVGHPHRALRPAAGHDDPAARGRRVLGVPEGPRRVPAGARRAHQDHGHPRHCRAPQAAGRQDQVPPAGQP